MSHPRFHSLIVPSEKNMTTQSVFWCLFFPSSYTHLHPHHHPFQSRFSWDSTNTFSSLPVRYYSERLLFPSLSDLLYHLFLTSALNSVNALIGQFMPFLSLFCFFATGTLFSDLVSIRLRSSTAPYACFWDCHSESLTWSVEVSSTIPYIDPDWFLFVSNLSFCFYVFIL